MPLSVTESKNWALYAIGAGTLIIGIIPAYFINRNNNEKTNVFVSGLLWFGIGVLLVDFPYLENRGYYFDYIIDSAAACGFFSLYYAHVIYSCRRKRFSSNQPGHIYSALARSTTHIPSDGILPKNRKLELNVSNAPSTSLTREERVYQHDVPSAVPEEHRDEEKSFVNHRTPLETKSNFYISHFGLTLALIIEAGAKASLIGFMPVIDGILLWIPKIFINQFVSAFWLSMELSGAYGFGRIHIIAVLLHSVASSLGVGIGMSKIPPEILLEVLQGFHEFAKGMILYVTLIEILPRERTRLHNSPMRLAGLMQFFSILFGYIFMSVIYRVV